MGLVTFDPACFVDMVFESAEDPRFPESVFIHLEKVSKTHLYVFTLKQMSASDFIYAYPTSPNDYHMSDDDLYSFIDSLANDLLTDLVESGILVPEARDDDDCLPRIDGDFYEVEDEYSDFMESMNASIFHEEDELLEIIREVLMRAAEDSAIRLTGKKNDVRGNLLLLE